MKELSSKTKIILLIDVFLLLTCIVGIYHVFKKAGLEPTAHVVFKQYEHKVSVEKVI